MRSEAKNRGGGQNDGVSNRRILNGFLMVGFFVFIGKIAGAAKEMTIAWRYGVSEKVDAYVFVFNLLAWPVSIWLSVLSAVLIPLIVKLRHSTPDQLLQFRAELLGLTLTLGVIGAGLANIIMPILLNGGMLGLSGRALKEGLGLINGLVLMIPFGMITSLFSAQLLAASHHRNTLFEAIPALIILIFLLLPMNLVSEPLLWGTVGGFAVQMIVMAVPLKFYGERIAFSFRRSSPAWRFFWGGIGIMTFGQALTSLSTIVDQFFAARLDVGALSKMSYANRILALIMSLGATAIARATLPVFSELFAQGEAIVKKMAFEWAVRMFVFGCVVAAVTWMIAPALVSILFERGAFTSKDTQAVTDIFRYGLLQVPTYFPGLVLVSALAAQRAHARIAFSGFLNLVFKLPLSMVLVAMFDLKGLLMATAIMYMISTCVLVVLLKTHKPRFA